MQVVEALVSTHCGAAGIKSSLMHSPDMLHSGLQLLLVVFRLSTAACEAAVGASFPQVLIPLLYPQQTGPDQSWLPPTARLNRTADILLPCL